MLYVTGCRKTQVLDCTSSTVYDMIVFYDYPPAYLCNWFQSFMNSIGDVMVSMVASSVVDRRVKLKTIKLVFPASPLRMQQRLVDSQTELNCVRVERHV